MFKVGDIVKIKGQQPQRQQGRRWAIERILDDRDFEGNPILKCRRVDAASHGIENWSQRWLELATSVNKQ